MLVGRAASLASFDTVFHWQAVLAVLTAVFALPVDTRPRILSADSAVVTV